VRGPGSRRAGIKTVILPERNEKDLTEVPESAKNGIRFVFVETVDDMLQKVFDSAAPESTDKTAELSQVNG